MTHPHVTEQTHAGLSRPAPNVEEIRVEGESILVCKDGREIALDLSNEAARLLVETLLVTRFAGRFRLSWING